MNDRWIPGLFALVGVVVGALATAMIQVIMFLLSWWKESRERAIDRRLAYRQARLERLQTGLDEMIGVGTRKWQHLIAFLESSRGEGTQSIDFSTVFRIDRGKDLAAVFRIRDAVSTPARQFDQTLHALISAYAKQLGEAAQIQYDIQSAVGQYGNDVSKWPSDLRKDLEARADRCIRLLHKGEQEIENRIESVLMGM